MEGKSRTRRTKEERMAELEEKIKFHRQKIENLEKQKKDLLSAPKKKKTKSEALTEIYKAAKANGKTLEDVLSMLQKGE